MNAERWQRIEALYHAALARAGGERAAFLAEACGGDAALREEVESLLAQPASAEGFLGAPARAAAAELATDQPLSVMTGRRLGVYELQGLLGAGGMGEVYRARDTKLGREVAIKILPRAFTSEPERLARFEREARVLATLNHPNIGAIYGLEEADGLRALVLELVEGQTLADVIAGHPSPEAESLRSRPAPAALANAEARARRAGVGPREQWMRDSEAAARRGSPEPGAPGVGPRRREIGGAPRNMKMPDVLAIARQIAEALEAAHDKGIIHRDLKPANVKITPAGVVKVLDFGLAKIGAGGAGGPGGDEFSQAPTVTIGGTHEGTILGTAAYMSPEQARGKPVDKRTDIWAFGCVLYEMLTGRAAFARETITDTLAAIVEREPDSTLLPYTTPASVRRLLQRCLEKDPKRRLHDIADARIELDDALEGEQTNPASNLSDPRRAGRRWRTLALASIGALVAAAVALAVIQRARQRATLSPAATMDRTIATQLTNYGGTEAGAALSPDGRSFVFASEHGGTPDIWLRQVSGGEPVRLTNDAAEEADLAYAPDGESIYFTRRDANGTGIWRTGVLGGQARKVVDGALKPALSPDGKSLAYVTAGKPGSFTLAVSTLDGGGTRAVVQNISGGAGAPRPAWSRDGRQLSYTAGALFGPIDLFVVDATTGTQRRVAQLPPIGNDVGQPAWLPDNRHLVVSYLPFPRLQAPSDLGIVDIQDGSISRLTTTVGDTFMAPSVSADGSRLIATGFHYLQEVWKVPLGPDPDANGRAAVRLIDTSASPMWTFVSRDGRNLLFNSPASGSRNLWMVPLDRSAPPRQITAVPGDAISHSSLSPDGTRVAFASIASGHSDIWTQRVDGSDLRQLTNDNAADSWPVWSPDGESIMYLSFRGERRETWRVRAAGGPSEKFLDRGVRGDWIREPEGNRTRIVTGGPGAQLIDVEHDAVVWERQIPGAGLSLPVFSPDGRSISAPFREARDHDVVRVFDTATGESRVAARLPFHVTFRASWADDGRAVVVNRNDQVSHIVMFDHFWASEGAR